MSPWQAARDKITGRDGVQIMVRLTPRAARDSFDGIIRLADGREALQAHVRAIPDRGRANKALIDQLAARLDLAPSRIRLVDGGTSLLKRLAISGDDDALMVLLAERLGLRSCPEQ